MLLKPVVSHMPCFEPGELQSLQATGAVSGDGVLLMPPGGERVCPPINCNMDHVSMCEYSTGQVTFRTILL